jgi:acyl-CoA thioesterase-1
MKRRLIVAVIIALTHTCAFPLRADDTTDNATPAKAITIVAFGDSTTAVRATIKQVYADRLPALLAAHEIEARVINAGVGGSHTGHRHKNDKSGRRHALDRFEDAVLDQQPDVVVMQFGWNDSWVDSDDMDDASRISVTAYRDNLALMMGRLREQGASVILMTPNRPRSSMVSWRVARTLQYVSAVRALAAETATPLVDIWRAYDVINSQPNDSADDLLLDDVHPGDNGQALVARLLVEPIVASQREAVE